MKNNIIFSIEQYINDQEMPKGKQKVILSAIELFASQGFHGTSTAQLAKNAEVSQATIYKYFETKDKLLVFILEFITFFIQLYILNIKPENLEEELKQIEKQILKLLS